MVPSSVLPIIASFEESTIAARHELTSSVCLRSVMSRTTMLIASATIGDHVRANLYTNQRTVLAAVAPLAADVPLLRQHALYVAVHVFLGVRDHIVERQP